MPEFIGELIPKGNFALIDSNNIRGGLMQVRTIGDRDSLPEDKIKLNSFVFVAEEEEIFRYTESGWAPFKVKNTSITGSRYLSPSFTVSKVENGIITVDRKGLKAGDIINFKKDKYSVITSVNELELSIEGETPELFDEVLLTGSISDKERSLVLVLEDTNGVLTLVQYMNTSISTLNTVCTFKLGYGANDKWKVYGDDVYFRGDFIDKRGRNISDLATVEYETLRREFGYDNLINNPSFITGFDCWDTNNTATYFTAAGKIILTDQLLLSSATEGAYVLVEDGQTVLKLTDGSNLVQSNQNLREIVDFEAGENTWFDLFYTYKAIEPGTLTISLNGAHKSVFNYSSNDYRVNRTSFKWDGQGDLSIHCTGKIKLKSIVIRPNETKTLIETYNLQPR